MTWEENWEFSLNKHGMVKPLADHFVGVRLDYYPIRGAWEPRAKAQGVAPGLDTGAQFILDPQGKILGHGRCWKNHKGFSADELREIGAKHPAKDALRLSWFLHDPAYFRKDIADDSAYERARTPEGAMYYARKMRRPLARVDGAALEVLEENQEFLKRHLRQFWWLKGDPQAPARVVVFHSNEFVEAADELARDFPRGKKPAVLAAVDLGKGVEIDHVSGVLDECWRKYMTARPSNLVQHRDNPSYRKGQEEAFQAVDDRIKSLAGEGRLLAPGGRALMLGK